MTVVKFRRLRKIGSRKEYSFREEPRSRRSIEVVGVGVVFFAIRGDPLVGSLRDAVPDIDPVTVGQAITRGICEIGVPRQRGPDDTLRTDRQPQIQPLALVGDAATGGVLEVDRAAFDGSSPP